MRSSRPPRPIEVSHEVIECAACGRSLLRGEHASVFFDSDMMRRMVCALCPERAASAGWLPEDAHRFMPAGRDDGRRRGLVGRLLRRGEGPATVRAARLQPLDAHLAEAGHGSVITRALEAFNASHYPGVVAGVARSLGSPFVSVLPRSGRGDLVSIVVGWELAWYRYEVDPDDGAEGVRVVGQGEQLSELSPYERLSNAAVDDEGCLRGEALAA